MKLIKPTFEILSCPDGEECLALLERVGRVAYKSEDKIDDGHEPCPHCGGEQPKGADALFYPQRASCLPCFGRGWVQVRPPSSHKFIRMILRADQQEVLARRIGKLLGERIEGIITQQEELDFAKEAVSLVYDELRNNPPHESVLEHAAITVLFTTNRGVTHELVRHRIASYTQESTRFCDYSAGRFGQQIQATERSAEDLCGCLDKWLGLLGDIDNVYEELRNEGVKPEIARDILPQVLKADIVMTANLREWRHVFSLRCSPRAHSDMRAIMLPLRDELRRRIPIVFEAT